MKRYLLPAWAAVTSVILTVMMSVGAWKHFFPPAAPNELTLPRTLAVGDREIVMIAAGGNAHQIQWGCPAKGVTLLPWPDGTQALFYAAEPGTFHVFAYGLDKKGHLLPHATCAVTVGGVGPTPTPVPPPQPQPNDSLVGKLQAAYASETESDKAASLAALAEVYAQGAGVATARMDLATWGQLFDALESAAKSVRVNGKIMAVQTVIQGELVKALPAPKTTALEDAGRKLAAATLDRIGLCLKAIR